MSPWMLGIVGGVAFGTIDALLMLPLQFPDKRTALTAAFFSRFAIGFLIPLCTLPLPWFVSGALIGLLISIPDALITKAYLPILVSGVLGGALLGWIAGRVAA